MIVRIGADIADMRKCEQHDLRRVGRVREDLLIARNRCIETQFADMNPFRTRACAEKNGTISEGDGSRRG